MPRPMKLRYASAESLDADIERVLIDHADIKKRVQELGEEINRAYAGQDLVLVSVLKGSVVFMADLMRAIKVPHEVDFMATSSYGGGTTSSGAVRILKDLNCNIEGRNVLLVEDIVDSGNTLSYLVRMLEERHPKSLHIMTLLDKPERRESPIEVKWVGFSIPNEFVVGYGLDYDEIYRNLPYIGVVKPSIYSES